MRAKERLCWAATGGVLLGIIIGLCISPLTAQDGNFGEITCTGLKVVNPDGTEAVELDSHFIKGYGYGGRVTVEGNGRKSPISGGTSSASMGVSADGTYAIFWNSEGIPGVLMGSGRKGGYVRLDRKGMGSSEDGSVSININENGGRLVSRVQTASQEQSYGCMTTRAAISVSTTETGWLAPV